MRKSTNLGLCCRNMKYDNNKNFDKKYYINIESKLINTNTIKNTKRLETLKLAF